MTITTIITIGIPIIHGESDGKENREWHQTKTDVSRVTWRVRVRRKCVYSEDGRA